MIIGAWLMVKHYRHGPAPAGELKTVTEFHDDKPLPAFQLSGPKGVFTTADLAGQWSFMFFGYTQCPDVCPTALTLMKTLKTRVSAVSPRLTFQTILVSVDPKRDTRELLDQYLAAFDPAFIGLRGDDAALQPLLKDLGVYFQRNEQPSPTSASGKMPTPTAKHPHAHADGHAHEHGADNYSVDHSAAIYLIDPQGRLAAVFSPPQQADTMAADFQRIASSR